jgi:hypothetical protein
MQRSKVHSIRPPIGGRAAAAEWMAMAVFTLITSSNFFGASPESVRARERV